VKISFDPAKRERTLAERGLDFADAAQVFEGPLYTQEDVRTAYPELRFMTFGLLHDRMVALVWTEASNGRRVISMRKANEREQARYRHRLG
jgi:uncharacterized protein